MNASLILLYNGNPKQPTGDLSPEFLQHHEAQAGRTEIGDKLGNLIYAWAKYAEAYQAEKGDHIGKDGFIGKQWALMGGNLRKLLNGDVGGFDSRSLDSNILAMMKHHGIDTSNL